MLEFDLEFHAKRALKQAELRDQEDRKRLEEEERQQQAQPRPLPVDAETMLRTGDSRSPLQRAVDSASLLGTGIALGATAGWMVGTVYALRKGHAQPLSVGLTAAMQLGMLGGQFIGIRELLPSGLERFYWRFMATESERKSGLPLSAMLSTLPDVPLPDFFHDLTDRDQAVLGTAAAGGMAGYLSNYLQVKSMALRPTDPVRHAVSAGIRGGIFWSILFSLGHLAWFKVDDWRKQRVVDQRLRNLYVQERFDEIRAILAASNDQTTSKPKDIPIPERTSVVGFTWKELLDKPHQVLSQSEWYHRALDYLPMVYSEKEFEYRAYLESKERLLEGELADLSKERKRLKRQIQKLEDELAQSR